jgi:hypothetical protein
MAPEEACEEAEQAQGWRRRETVRTRSLSPSSTHRKQHLPVPRPWQEHPHGSRRPRRGAQPIASSGKRTSRGRPT